MKIKNGVSYWSKLLWKICFPGTENEVEVFSSRNLTQHRRKNAKPLVVIEAGHTLQQAMELLAEHDILGAPVVQSKTQTGAFLGFIDVLDIAGYILQRYHLDPDKVVDASFVDEEIFGEPVER